MRLLHVSDWHLGTTLGRVRRTSDHDEVLDEIVDVAAEFRPHLVVHTGDLFDHSRPAVEDLHRGVDALRRLADHAPVVVLAGNHDSPAMFDVFNRFLALGAGPGRAPVHFVGRARSAARGGILTFPGDDGEEVRLAPVPFIHPNTLLDTFDVAPERWTASYTDQVRLIEGNLGSGLTAGYDPNRHVLLFAAHLHVGGAAFSGSERPLHITDSYATSVEHLPAVSYAAFGHIHKPQPLPGGVVQGRYAGSPIPIDFGERGERKSVVCVEAQPGRVAIINEVPLSGGRPLVRVQGRLEELAGKIDEVGRAIVAVTVDTDEPTPELAAQVAELFPEATIFDVIERCRKTAVAEAQPLPDGEEPPIRDLFRAYLAEELPAIHVESTAAVFDRLLEAAEAASVADFDDEEELFRTPEHMTTPSREVKA